MGSLGKLVSYARTGEFDKIGRAVAERVPWWLFHRGQASVFEVRRSGHAAAVSGTTLPHGYACRLATRDEMAACSRITGIDVAEYLRRFDAGNICYGVFAGGRPVNINWVHAGACYVRGMGFALDSGPGDKYVYGIMTDPAERGKGLYKSCLVNLAEYLFASGAERIIQMVEAGNTPVLVTLPQLGYTKTHEIRYITIFGMKRTTVVDLTTNRCTTHRFVSTPNDRFVI